MNSYGHPTEDVLSRLRDADVRVYRTDMQGHITCTSDGKTVTFTPQKNADADTLAGAGAGQKSGQSGQGTDTVIPLPSADELEVVDSERSMPGQSEITEPPAEDLSPVQETTPVGQAYVLNTNTKKFHYPECGSVNKMSEKNKEYYSGSRDDVVSRGYSPCGNCHP